MPESQSIHFLVGKEEEGERLDVVISNHLPDCSRTHAGALIRDRNISVRGCFKKPGYRVRIGDEIRGEMPRTEKVPIRPEPIHLQIIHEDQDIIVLNKQPGLVVHPAPGHDSGTLVNGLLDHCPDIGPLNGEHRPGIVHRLDKDTSGTMVVAKNQAAHHHLSAQFKNRTVVKIYLALVLGAVKADSGRIGLPIGRHPVHRKKMSVVSHKAREAETLWWVEKKNQWVTLLKLRLNTGRTHQIRVHCKAIHHPIVGDPVYGGTRPPRETPRTVSDVIRHAHRQMLHASSLTLTHPGTGEKMTFTSPLPQDMEDMLRKLEMMV